MSNEKEESVKRTKNTSVTETQRCSRLLLLGVSSPLQLSLVSTKQTRWLSLG